MNRNATQYQIYNRYVSDEDEIVRAQVWIRESQRRALDYLKTQDIYMTKSEHVRRALDLYFKAIGVNPLDFI